MKAFCRVNQFPPDNTIHHPSKCAITAQIIPNRTQCVRTKEFLARSDVAPLTKVGKTDGVTVVVARVEQVMDDDGDMVVTDEVTTDEGLEVEVETDVVVVVMRPPLTMGKETGGPPTAEQTASPAWGELSMHNAPDGGSSKLSSQLPAYRVVPPQ